MKKTGHYLLQVTTWIFHILPMRVNYIFSDFLFVIVYHVARYRREVVRKNLANSFPEKTPAERKEIEKRFYHHLCDIFIETFCLDHLSPSEAKKRIKFNNPDLVSDYLNQGKSVVGVLGHYGNWEWLCSWPLYSDHRFYAIYKRLKNLTFENFYYRLRTRYGARPLERADVYRQLISDYKNGIPTFTSFISDQTPRIYDIHYWTDFLNQDTPILDGAEKVAVKLDAAVIYAEMRKIKRGYYEVEYFLITDKPRETAKFEISEKSTRMLEKTIQKYPEYWLWSHKRWKHKRSH